MKSRSAFMTQRTIVLFALVSFVMTPVLASAELGHVTESTTPHGRVDWTTGHAIAHGIGIPPAKSANARQAKEMTRNAAWIVAQRNLLEVIKGVHIDSTTTVSNYIATNDEVQAKVEGFIKGARLVKEQEMPDGSYETTVEIKLGGELSKYVIPQITPKPTPLPQYQNEKKATSAPTSFTGLVVDARGLGAHPALAPRLLNDQGDETYSVAYVDQRVASKEGIVLYVPDPASAQANQRVTNNPLLIKARRADGADLYISNADASTLHAVPKHFEFLKQAKVLVILDEQPQH